MIVGLFEIPLWEAGHMRDCKMYGVCSQDMKDKGSLETVSGLLSRIWFLFLELMLTHGIYGQEKMSRMKTTRLRLEMIPAFTFFFDF